MDFLKLIRSLEDLLFEVLTWIIYYPRTLWMVMRRPLQMIDYSDHEQTDAEQEQYTDTMSPPLLLLLTLVIGHVIEINTHGEAIKTGSDMARMVASSDQNLIALRAFLFGLLPLFAAVNFVKHRNLPLERKHLRAPFFGECYVAAIFALLVTVTTSVGAIFPTAKPVLIPLGFMGSTAWFLTIETLQMRRALGFSVFAALTRAVWILAKALAITALVGVALAGGLPAR